MRQGEALGEPWWDRAGTRGDMWALSSWGQLGPCTGDPKFSVFPLWLSSVWSPSPLRGLCAFQCYLINTGGLRAPSSPLCLSHLGAPLLFFPFYLE